MRSAGVPWKDYSPQPGWSGKYRICHHHLEIELQTFSRSAPETDVFNLDQLLPPGLLVNLEKSELTVMDSYRAPSIFLGTRLPEHWVRTVSIVVGHFTGDLTPCA